MPIAKRMAVISQQQPFTIESVFNRASVAYDKDGNQVPANTPRFGMAGVDEPGLLIEESTTNILTAEASQSLSSPYTTGTLNGTYTFSCKTGSIVLSGGASGTVTPTNPITATITSATVTLTPATTATYNQIENKAYKTSWTLGGTSRSSELCSLSPDVLNLSEGTIELEIYINNAFKNTGNNRTLIAHSSTTNNAIKLYYSTSGNLVFMSYNASGTGSTVYFNGSNLSLGNWVKLAIVWDVSNIKMYLNGSQLGNITNNPNLPSSHEDNIWIGQINNSYVMNSLIRNVVISKIKRTDMDIQARANTGFPMDKFVTAKGLLTENLSFKGMAKV